MVATVEPTATAPAAANGASLSRTRLRRVQRQVRVEALRSWLRDISAHAAGDEELQRRLRTLRRQRRHGLAGVPAPTLRRQRRRAALHVFDVAAATIATASGPELNAMKRGRRLGRGARQPDDDVSQVLGEHRQALDAERAARASGEHALAQRLLTLAFVKMRGCTMPSFVKAAIRRLGIFSPS